MSGFRDSTKMKSGFSFPTSAGFTSSTGKVQNISYTRKTPQRKPMMKAEGGKITRAPGQLPRRETTGGALENLGKALMSKPRGIPKVEAAMAQAERGYAEGGRVRDTALHGPTIANGLDQEAGPERALRPGFAKGGKNWIAGATKNKGALHRALHVPEGQKIPAKKLAKAAHSDNPTMRKRAALAKTLGKMHKAEGGKVHSDAAQDRPMMEKIAKQAVSKHVGAAAPMGHKGMGNLLKGCK